MCIRDSYKALQMPAWEMCRVLGNLIDNAMDAVAEADEKKMTVALFEDVRSHGFRVSNSGPDIPAAQRATIFTPGFTTKRTGQGMGLYIVSSLLQDYGGEIQVESGGGVTAFTGRIPRKIASEAGAGAEKEKMKEI